MTDMLQAIEKQVIPVLTTRENGLWILGVAGMASIAFGGLALQLLGITFVIEAIILGAGDFSE